MKRRALFLAATLGLVAASLTYANGPSDHVRQPGRTTSCEECRANCNNIPMHPDDCIDLYCPECAGTATPVGVEDSAVAHPEIP